MARIPDATDFGLRPEPSARVPRTVDATGDIYEGVGQIGRAAQQLGGQIEARDDQANYAQARSTLLQADIAARQSLQNDPDYGTYDARYREAMQKARDAAGKVIRSRYDLAAFNRDAEVDLARGAAAVAGLARQKAVDVGRATLDTTIQNNRTAALDATDEATRSALIGATLESIAGAQKKGFLSAQEAVATRQKWTTDYAEGFLEIQSPEKRLAILQNPKGTPADFLPADIRARLGEAAQREVRQQQVAAQAAQADSIANAVLGTYAKAGPDAGAAQLAKLQKSGLSEDVLNTVYGKVSTGVSRMRDVQQQAHANDIANLYSAIEAKTVGPESYLAVEKLWDAGALTPLEKASLVGRIEGAHRAGAEQAALATTVREAFESGTPLDPSNSDQRKAVGAAFTQDAQGVPTGSPSWQSLAAAYAVRTRMLPDPAASWARSALRSPDPKVAAPAVQFFGSIASQAPDAVSGFDTQTKAFAGMANSMIEAGTPPEKAVEVARQTTLEQNPTVLKQREETYRKVTDSDSVLDNYIDRDFDPSVFSSQPDAPAGLKLDFAQQAGRYFQYTGDLQSARDLAWQDIKRIYGVSEVNGTKQMMVLPPERFGVKADEIRTDIASFLSGERAPKTVRSENPDDVVLVPDSLTLRSVNDILSGKPAMPSYKLVSKAGELLLDDHGVPLRYTLPSSEELTAKLRQAQETAAAQAEQLIKQARFDRDTTRRRRELYPEGAH